MIRRASGTTRFRLQDVADRAGVSKSIASRVLNNRGDVSVSPETRRRIVQVADELGYVPNTMARSLSQSRTYTIACVFPPLTNPFYARVTNAAYRRALEQGYVVLVAEDSGEHDIEESLKRLVDSSRVDGLLVASARPGHTLISTLAGSAMPHVFVNRDVPGSERNVVMDDRLATQIVVEYLAELGHRNIAHLVGPVELLANHRRSTGFVQTAENLGLTAREVVCHGIDEKAGYGAAAELLEGEPVTAVYISSLRRAVGALRLFADRSVSVPDDISIVSNDDVAIAEFLVPSLTTVSMPVEALGRTAIDEIVNQINGGTRRNVVIPSEPTVIPRESSRRVA